MTATGRNKGMHAMSDAYLVRAMAAGMRDAFAELTVRYMPLVSRCAYRILCDRSGSDEVTGKVFLRLWLNASEYDESLNVSQWICRMVCGLCVGRLRRLRVLEAFSVRTPVYEMSAPQASDSGDGYIIKESWDIFCRASRNLTPRQRVVFVLTELEGLEEEDVAVIMGISCARVRRNKSVAEVKIRSELELYGEVR